MDKLRVLAMLYNVLKFNDLVVPDVEHAESFTKLIEDAGYNPSMFDVVVVLNNHVGMNTSSVIEEAMAICDLL